MAKNLVTFSGGADSALLVYKLLTETEDDNTLLILCANRVSDVGSWALPRQTLLDMQPLLSELKTYRDFKVIYHVVQVESINSMLDDMWYTYAIKNYASQFNQGIYDRFVSAVGFEQNNGKFMKNYDLRGVRPYFEAKHMFETSVSKGEFWAPFVTNDFYNNYNRWHLRTSLPKKLMDSSLSCLKIPRCGVCGKCLYDNKVRQCIADGWTAEDLQDWTEEKSQYYGGGNGRDATIIYWIHAETGVNKLVRPGVLYQKKNDSFDLYDLESFNRWYDTVEYTVITDWKLRDWNLNKEDWQPPPSV
jgi:hypothetical protein